MFCISPAWLVSILCMVLEGVLFAALWASRPKTNFVFFNPQDYAAHVKSHNLPVVLPIASEEATFEPLLKQYIDVSKFLVTIAAASISFGGLHPGTSVYVAKLILAFSIFFALMFCISATYFYESYLHDLESYKPIKCALVESLGLSSMVLFFAGYCYWAIQLRQMI